MPAHKGLNYLNCVTSIKIRFRKEVRAGRQKPLSNCPRISSLKFLRVPKELKELKMKVIFGRLLSSWQDRLIACPNQLTLFL
jgi:hypothetical protein